MYFQSCEIDVYYILQSVVAVMVVAYQLGQTQFLLRAALLDKAKSKGRTSKCKGLLTTAFF